MTIAHHAIGSGEPVILLNGGMMTMAAWDPIAIPLSQEFRVIRCDLRGQLLSPGASHPTLNGHADDVVEVLDAFEIERAHVVGTSFGALVGMVLAARQSERVASLVVGTATEHVSDAEWRAALPFAEACQAAARGTGDGGGVVDRLFPTTFSDRFRAANAGMLGERRARVAALPPAYFEGLGGILALLNGLDLRPLLPAIGCRTLVLGAADDRTFLVAHSRALAAGIRGSRLEILEGAAHGVFAEEPHRVLPILQTFLRG